MATPDPVLIPGIYSYCDRRCERCRFTPRCYSFRESVPVALAPALEFGYVSPGATASSSLLPLPLPAEAPGTAGPGVASTEQDAAQGVKDDAAYNDDLVVQSREYAFIMWRILRTLRPIVQMRGDRDVAEALSTAEHHCGVAATKIFRAVWGAAQPEFDAGDVQDDANGSAKVARLCIDESRRAWRVLMEVGRASADGVPARLVAMLDDLDAGIAARFPRAMDFVRPGFDTEGATSPASVPAMQS